MLERRKGCEMFTSLLCKLEGTLDYSCISFVMATYMYVHLLVIVGVLTFIVVFIKYHVFIKIFSQRRSLQCTREGF